MTYTPKASGTALQRAATITEHPSWFLLTFGVTTGIALLDIVAHSVGVKVVIIGLLITGPLLACVRLNLRQTALICLYAFACALALGHLDKIAYSADHFLRMTPLLFTTMFALWVTHVRVARDDEREDMRLAAERASFLAEATTLLNSSLDYRETTTLVARATVPELADWCIVHLVENGRINLLTLACADPSQEPLGYKINEQHRPRLGQAGDISQVIATGSSRFVPDVRSALRQRKNIVEHPERRELAEQLNLQSAMITPINVHGRCIGSITFLTQSKSRTFTEEDFVLAKDLSARTGIAIQHARLYQDRARVADTLQASLLPPELPVIPGFELHARYRALENNTEVGGDFYDVFPVRPGSWLALIGDVQGKGIEAAVLTNLIHYTVRTLSMEESSPARILERLNHVVLTHRNGERFCTLALCLLTVDDTGADITVALGGHPQPLLRRANGNVETIGLPGTLIGLPGVLDVHEENVRLNTDDTLLLFSDGVTEARENGVMLGDDGLIRELASADGMDVRALLDHLEEIALEYGGGVACDDIALLALRCPQRRPVHMTRQYPAQSDSVPSARHDVLAACTERPDLQLDELALLTTELVSNAIQYGYPGSFGDGAVEVRLEVSESEARCEIINHGVPFTTDASDPGPESNGGRGLFLVDHFAGVWGQDITDAGRVKMWFVLPCSRASTLTPPVR